MWTCWNTFISKTTLTFATYVQHIKSGIWIEAQKAYEDHFSMRLTFVTEAFNTQYEIIITFCFMIITSLNISS